MEEKGEMVRENGMPYGGIGDHGPDGENSKLSLLLDIPLEVTVEIGTTEMLIEEVLKLNPNSIIELDRYINEPIDLKINGKVIAKGELYTVKSNFGIRITQIVTPEDRLKILDMKG
ncbi:MAG: flagellar motor switch protein FliN [Epsilonproteobacteria bacterium]|nr:flagellar motor switch protein FliN [Campylobacterota bacterium]NPA57380.1 flagellar motor switch protein FliN [Campylobacterota bacterium]